MFKINKASKKNSRAQKDSVEKITKVKQPNPFSGFQTSLVLVFIAALLVFGLQYSYATFLLKPAVEANQSDWLRQKSALMAVSVQRQLDIYNHILDGFVQSAAFQKQLQDKAVSQRFLAQLEVVLPYYKAARIFYEVPLQPDDDSVIPVTNVAIQSVSNGLKGQSIPAEVVGNGTENDYLMLVRTVKLAREDADESTAFQTVLFVALDKAILSDLFKSAAGFNGYVEIQQVFADASRSLAKFGQARWKSGNGTMHKISGSQWRIAAWPDDSAVTWFEEQELIQWGLGGIGAAIIVLLGSLAISVLYSRSKRESIVFADLVREGLKTGHWSEFSRLRLVLWRRAIEEVAFFAKQYRSDGQTNIRNQSSESVALPEEAAAVVPAVAETEDAIETEEKTAAVDELLDRPAPAEEAIVRELEFDLGDSSWSQQAEDESAQQEVQAQEAAILQAARDEVMSFDEALQKPDAAIFRAYDIRGIVGDTLQKEHMYLIGRSIGSEIRALKQEKVFVARDGRLSSEELTESLIQGFLDAGCSVIHLGAVTTPMLYFATHESVTRHGVIVTGSHNPENYNGLKIVLNGEVLAEGGLQRIYRRIEQDDYSSGNGDCADMDIFQQYLERITQDIVLAKPLKVVIDCGNAVAGATAPHILEALGCEVVPLFCDVDGHFPNHHPDPGRAENLLLLSQAVVEHQADIGLALDGDADRLGVVDAAGTIIWPDRQMMLFAQDLLTRHPGADIIYDVKSSRNLAQLISQNGGRPVMWKTGHSMLKHKLKESGALLAGEYSGHILFAERWYGFDDGLYAGVRLLEILAADPRSSTEIFQSLPDSVATPEIQIPMADELKFAFMEKLMAQADFAGGNIIDIDGLRVDYTRGWGLVRCSNTTPNLVLRFEADDELALSAIQDEFKQQLLKIEPTLQLPF